VVANGAEGEPLSVKDRYLMRHRPHLVLDGTALAAAAVGATHVHLYVTDPVSRAALEQAHRAAVAARIALPEVTVWAAQDTYVAGEATAAVRAINTGVARPIDATARIAERGVADAPTLMSNVETLARLARAGTARAPGPADTSPPLLVTVSGCDATPALVEVPYGLRAGELVDAVAGPPAGRHVLTGGFFGGLLPLTGSLRLSTESMAAHGGALGCPSLYVIAPDADPIAVAATAAAYYADNNARQCRTCVRSTSDVAALLRGDTSTGDPSGRLARWSTQLVGRGACAMPDGVALLLRSLLRHYPRELDARLAAATAEPGAVAASWEQLTVPVPAPHARGGAR
jgi:NADH:ubiquinone oxidoreductase subunit F (NADH-binding)